jgi:hypothetical protein
MREFGLDQPHFAEIAAPDHRPHMPDESTRCALPM